MLSSVGARSSHPNLPLVQVGGFLRFTTPPWAAAIFSLPWRGSLCHLNW